MAEGLCRSRRARDGDTLVTRAPESASPLNQKREFRPKFDAEGWPSGRWRWS